jgi:radical SAM protein with 4Fe4S-binding SPASM domain
VLQFGKIQLTGGELFLHPQVWDIIDVACAGSFEEVEIYTNMTLLDKTDLIRLKSLRVKLATSLLGFDSVSHDNCTQTPGSFDVWYRNIKCVQSLGIPFRIGVVAMKQNQELMPRIEYFLRHEGLLAPDKLFTPDEYRPMGRNTDKLVTPVVDNTQYEPYLTVSREYFGRAKSFNPCWKGQAAITPEGSVFPCVFSRCLKVGDLHDESLGQVLSRIEKEYWTINLDKIEKCQDCELRYACMDCRAMCLNLGRGLYGPPVRCSYNPYN